MSKNKGYIQECSCKRRELKFMSTREFYGGDSNILYLARDVGFMGVCVC